MYALAYLLPAVVRRRGRGRRRRRRRQRRLPMGGIEMWHLYGAIVCCHLRKKQRRLEKGSEPRLFKTRLNKLVVAD
jgi:hypothetical protein